MRKKGNYLSNDLQCIIDSLRILFGTPETRSFSSIFLHIRSYWDRALLRKSMIIPGRHTRKYLMIIQTGYPAIREHALYRNCERIITRMFPGISRSVKMHHARYGSTRWRGNGTRSTERIGTDFRGTGSSCNGYTC